MTGYSSLAARTPAEMEYSLSGESSPLAGLLCLAGIFIHILLSGPVLDTIGITYSDVGGQLYEKIHPGTYCIFLSLAVLLLRRGNPIGESHAVWRQHTIYASVFVLFIILLGTMATMSGPAGLAFFIDTHLTVPVCAMVLCYMPVSWCRRAVHLFIVAVTLNSLIGIAEATGKFHLIPFDPERGMMKEQLFRATALQGYPLNNTMLTAVALFVMMGMRYAPAIKLLFIAIFITSLVAFGGRAGFVIAVAGLLLLGAASIARQLSAPTMTMRQLLALLTAAVAAPACLFGGILLLIESPLGERFTALGWWDKSAHSRQLALMALDYMKSEEILLGVSSDRIMDITSRMNLDVPISYIENPWLLMFMHLGLLAFPLWLMGTLALAWRLMKGQNPALKLAVLGYFLVASTSNSFGRKDSVYLIMAGMVTCAGRYLTAAKKH